MAVNRYPSLQCTYLIVPNFFVGITSIRNTNKTENIPEMRTTITIDTINLKEQPNLLNQLKYR